MAADIDTSPQSEAQPDAVGVAAAVAETPGDGYGSITASFGTELLRVCPPKAGRFTRVHSTVYDCGSTAHTLTMMVPLDKTQVASDAASGQAVIKLKKAPVDAGGTKIAASDYIVVKDETGIFGVYKVASVSGLSITITTSVGSADGSGFVNKVLADAAVWFYGTASDHSKRQFTMKASTVTTLPDAINGWATSPGKFEPVVIHSDNSTAAGILVAVSYSNPKI
jgi:hypothetical protein